MEDFSKKYYKIRDVAEFIGVPQATLRYWETEFPEISPSRTATGLRQYTSSDIETLRIVHYLIKIKGLKMDAAKAQFRQNRNNISKRLKIISELQGIRSELEVMLMSLTKRRQN
ncbi:MAG: MerR family transcriptional regulator [Muribaculaceae bacterium]|nr:MerR family transcriptional regulator [Muribaculaceae bacterium]